jgi:hypothetical protein
MPKVPTFTEGWQLGQPDLVLEMLEAVRHPGRWAGCLSQLCHSGGA